MVITEDEAKDKLIEEMRENARLRSRIDGVWLAFRELKRYRANNTINFQLEKLDDYIRKVQKELEADE